MNEQKADEEKDITTIVQRLALSRYDERHTIIKRFYHQDFIIFHQGLVRMMTGFMIKRSSHFAQSLMTRDGISLLGIHKTHTLSSKSTATNKRCIARKLFIF